MRYKPHLWQAFTSAFDYGSCVHADLLYPSTTVMDLNIGAALWLAARAQGTLLVHTPDSHLPKDDSPSADAASTCTAALHNRSSPQPNGSGGRAERVTEEIYRSRARVVLLGHGADELCAGYGRHRTRFRLLVSSCLVLICASVLPRLKGTEAADEEAAAQHHRTILSNARAMIITIF